MPFFLVPAVGLGGYLYGRTRSTSTFGKVLMVAGGVAMAYGAYRVGKAGYRALKKG